MSFEKGTIEEGRILCKMDRSQSSINCLQFKRGRILDGTNVNHTLIEDGWCWWYWKYAPGDTVLEGLEKEAREAKNGLWADPQPVPPWEWRRRK
jgi:endonuclease YncB( thermonuclease family)